MEEHQSAIKIKDNYAESEFKKTSN